MRKTENAAEQADTLTLPGLITWINGQHIGNPEHDAFIDGIGAATDIIADQMADILPRCVNGKLHRVRDDMEFMAIDWYQCPDCGEEIRGDSFVRYETLESLIRSEDSDWKRAGTGEEQ